MAMAYLAKNWISDMIPGGRKSWRLEKTPHHDCEAISVHAAYNAIFILSWVRLAIDLVLPNSPSYFGAVMLAKLEK